MSRCDCYHCQRSSVHNQYSSDPKINVCVSAAMLSMDPNPYDRRGSPCPTRQDIIALVEHAFGKKAAKRVWIELH
jgi:hypothetical protein